MNSNVLEDYENLNQAVEDILKGRKCNSMMGCDRKRRIRLLPEQAEFLEIEFLKNPMWTSRKMSQISKRLSLAKSKIYKWNWDRKKKEGLTSK